VRVERGAVPPWAALHAANKKTGLLTKNRVAQQTSYSKKITLGAQKILSQGAEHVDEGSRSKSMTVIAMTHEVGTRGAEIAAMLASRLDLDFADQFFIGNRIADRSARDKGLFEADLFEADLFEAGQCKTGQFDATASPKTSNTAGLRAGLKLDDRQLARYAEAEIQELAAYGNTIVRGWGATSVLRDSGFAIRIRLIAPMEFRLRTIAQCRPALSDAARRQFIERSDSCLASNLEPVLGPDWRAASNYHLVIGVHLTTIDDCVASIERFVRACAHGSSRIVTRRSSETPTDKQQGR
jgi:cytidylate kinase